MGDNVGEEVGNKLGVTVGRKGKRVRAGILMGAGTDIGGKLEKSLFEKMF